MIIKIAFFLMRSLNFHIDKQLQETYCDNQSILIISNITRGGSTCGSKIKVSDIFCSWNKQEDDTWMMNMNLQLWLQSTLILFQRFGLLFSHFYFKKVFVLDISGWISSKTQVKDEGMIIKSSQVVLCQVLEIKAVWKLLYNIILPVSSQ